MSAEPVAEKGVAEAEGDEQDGGGHERERINKPLSQKIFQVDQPEHVRHRNEGKRDNREDGVAQSTEPGSLYVIRRLHVAP